MARFDGKTVFITGGANPRGMSFATARAFLDEGASVFLYDIDDEGLPGALGALGGDRVAGRAGDVRSREQIRDALGVCRDRFGAVDVLINHAGLGPSVHSLDIAEDDWDTVVGTNLTGVFRVGQEVARQMAQSRGGVILNMSSSGAIASEPGHAHYAASKAGIIGFIKALAREVGPDGVTACVLLPGDVDTYEWPNVELARMYRSKIAAGRSARPEEVAAVYLFLASDDAQHLNGAAFVVDGGMLAWE